MKAILMADHIETPCPLSINPLSVRVDRNRCTMLGHVLHGPTEVPAHGSLVFAMSALDDLLSKPSNDHHQPLLQHVFLLFLKLCNAGVHYITHIHGEKRSSLDGGEEMDMEVCQG